ncbi:hypothetical protein M409DRAFT_50164 [Zasmidium cellare ATCC 36951]|uniref:Retinol dehydrogenase 12 n=1 Tax=Zasmidium cellare ATCC 36951 TaxID=1080233 RepID=A0A6A6D228_ZASCE|nr:uncharacterized protein M409DRAFT_50164 [Zasmidium cellare ATCC 36951]KAF2172470.1 hypothetical protein M409DRAFT_50164 [Zasmidium cellare ATCC 36951]
MSSAVKAAQTTLSENFGGAAHKLAPADTRFSLEDVPDQTGKVAVITGGSEGIGYGCSHTLLSKNISKVYILSVSKDVVDGAKDAVSKELGEDKAGRVKWIQCDLSDWDRVLDVAKEIQNSTDRLDILINNAGRGIMTYQLTYYGVDRHMALNHMGHAILTSNLLDLLKKTADGGDTVRITSLASNAHQGAPKDTKFESLDELNQDLGPNGQYGRSKLAAILYSKYLANHVTKQHPNLLANATHPGVVSTKMSTNDIHEPYPLAGYLMSAGLELFKKTQFDGALSTLYASTVTRDSGQYICPPAAPEPGNELAQNYQLAENLMKLTREVVRERGGIDLKDC